ncbi:pseudouridine synthase [Hyphomonas jannaschiana]|uniref:Dual-specificity RNA pseudouridine synthase RluA n=1 Tax=Hyphomonas jannaschiana VP2 TaxID=1280952 RepID=A0A059FDH4_9PROT|nr:pseudouridine synthase [Hyphomonas jannaschiana]KCZ88700.1 RNA pseudouridine synthase family protein [Hyphomonas jannaschiana VP2]
MTPYTPPQNPVRYVHVDDHLIVIDKPSGLLSVPGRGPEKADCAVARVNADHPGALTVHRLDMATSGLLILARSKEMQSAMSGLFERGTVEKAYTADVWGKPDPPEGEIDLPLITDWPNRPRQKVDHETGKPSRTLYEVMEHHADHARLRLTPLTGRSHQLRVHLAEIGHPILGDRLYAHAAALAAAPRLHLHASELIFEHPVTGVRLTLTSPCPF